MLRELWDVDPKARPLLAMLAARSFGLIDTGLAEGMASTATVLTILSMAALGLGIDLRRVMRAGPRVTAAVVLSLGVLIVAIAVWAALAVADRVQISGPDVLIGLKGASTLSLLIHELTTNAIKYGALSNNEGHVLLEVAVSKKQDDAVFSLR